MKDRPLTVLILLVVILSAVYLHRRAGLGTTPPAPRPGQQ